MKVPFRARPTYPVPAFRALRVDSKGKVSLAQ